jgi:formylmethanofuran dehydrogenase subunit D
MILITGTTVTQAQSKEGSKLSPRYMESVAICEISDVDMEKLGVKPGDHVKISSLHGSVVVKVVKAKEQNEGVVFMPPSPWSNLVTGHPTGGTGIPTFKSLEVEVNPAPDEPILTLQEIFRKIYGLEV